jgi:O-antigen ligase
MTSRNLYSFLGKVYYGLFYLILFCVPLFRGVVYPVERVLFSGGIFILFLVFELRGYIKTRRFFSTWDLSQTLIWMPLCLVFLVWIHRFFISARPYESLLRTWDFTAFVFIYFLSRGSFISANRRDQLCRFLVFLGSFYAGLGLCQAMGWIEHPWWETPGFLSGPFVNHNHFAGFLELNLFFLIGFLLARRSTTLFPLLALFLLQWSAFLLTLSRGGWIALALASLALSLILIKERELRGLGLRLLIGMFLVMSLFFAYIALEIDPEVTKRAGSVFTSQGQFEFMDFRVKLWKSTLKAIAERPVSGYGLGSFAWEMRPFRQKGFEFAFDYAHNDWLQFPMELGIPLFLGGCIFLGLLLIRATKRLVGVNLYAFRFEELGLLGGVLSLMIHSLVDFNLHIYGNAVLFVLFLGVLSAEAGLKKRH